jgi:membrane protein DedA with SNARE-associated domain
MTEGTPNEPENPGINGTGRPKEVWRNIYDTGGFFVLDNLLSLLNQFGYLGVFLAIMAENIFPPIPSEVILSFGGFMTTKPEIEMNVWGVIAAATAGSSAGAAALYAVGRVLNAQRLERLFDGRVGKLLRLKKSDVRQAEKWFLKHGNKAVFFCRLVPIVRSLISIPAGIARMNISPFMAFTVIGALIWNAVLVFLGKAAGEAWMKIARYFDIYSTIAAVALLFAAALAGYVFIRKRFPA